MMLWLLHKVSFFLLSLLSIVPGVIHIFMEDGGAMTVAGMKNYERAKDEIQFCLFSLGIYQLIIGFILYADFFGLVNIKPFGLWLYLVRALMVYSL